MNMQGLSIRVPDLGNPYRDLIASFLARTFPANLENKGSVLEALTAAFLASSKTRFGPVPGPESLVAIRRVLSAAASSNTPIPILLPWGSKKPRNEASIDIAELGALKQLSELQDRVLPFHPAGLAIDVRVEDATGWHLFKDEGEAAIEASKRYVDDFVKLVRVLDLPFIDLKLESKMLGDVPTNKFIEHLDDYVPLFIAYLNATDLHGLEGYYKLSSYQELQQAGWRGEIPKEQRDYYRQRFAALHPGASSAEQTERLARYFAEALVRVQLNLTGAPTGEFIKLTFVPPVPGLPQSMGDRTIYYRTLPETMTRTHLPPWRAHGFLKIEGREVTPKLASWFDPSTADLQPCTVEFERHGEVVTVGADQRVIG